MSDIKMRGPEGAANTLSHDGVTYKADKKGVFTVPVEAYESLARHGFEAVGQPKTEEEIAAEEAARAAAEEAARLEVEQKAAEEAALAAEDGAGKGAQS